MRCETCGREISGGVLCLNCGRGTVDAESALRLSRVSDFLSSGHPERAFREVQPVVRDNPDAFLPRLILARAGHRLVRQGKTELAGLVDREFAEAIRLLPPDRDAHAAMLTLAAELGRMDRLRAVYLDRFGSLPFAGEIARAVDSAMDAAPRTSRSLSGPAKAAGALLAALTLGICAWLAVRPPENVETESAPDGAEEGEKTAGYTPGVNLLVNGDAGSFYEGWERRGAPSLMRDGDNAFFRLTGHAELDSELYQEIRLPSPRPDWVLVAARSRAGHEPEDGMSGLPYIWGDIRDASGEVVVWINDERTMHRRRAGEWGVCWGGFKCPRGDMILTLRLRQALKAGGTRAGTYADFDDAGVFMFSSRSAARAFAESYSERTGGDRTPPAVPESSEPGPPPAGRRENLAAAKEIYEQLGTGMSGERAAEIIGFDSRSRTWTRDFGPHGHPDTVVLRVYFRDERIVRAEISALSGGGSGPEETIEEKGVSRDEAGIR